MSVATSPQYGGFNRRNITGQCVESVPRDYSTQRENAGAYTPGQSMFVYSAKIAMTSSSQTLSLIQPPLQTTTPINGVPNSSNTGTNLTVPSKAVYITDIYINTNDTTTQTEFDFQLSVGGQTIPIDYRIIKGDTCPADEPGHESQVQVPPGCTLQVVVPADTGKTAYITIKGFQQNIGAF